MDMRTSFKALAIVLAVAVSAVSGLATGPEPAKSLLNATIIRSHHEHKMVFLSFHASWCGWCHKLDDFLKDPEIKPIVDKHLNVLWIDCLEQGAKKDLENPGAAELMAQYGADKGGIPAMFIIDGHGKTVASSFIDGKTNIGYPGEPNEIVHFLKMMKTAGLSESELATVKANIEVRAAKLKH